MTALVQELLDTFDRLTDAERLDLLSEILKRSLYLDFPPLSDEDLILNAEELFLELDEREAVWALRSPFVKRCPNRYHESQKFICLPAIALTQRLEAPELILSG